MFTFSSSFSSILHSFILIHPSYLHFRPSFYPSFSFILHLTITIFILISSSFLHFRPSFYPSFSCILHLTITIFILITPTLYTPIRSILPFSILSSSLLTSSKLPYSILSSLLFSSCPLKFLF